MCRRRSVDVVSSAHSARILQLGPLSLLVYRLHNGQYDPRRLLRIRVHLQWRSRCMEMAL